MKKILALFLALIMVVGVVASCTNPNTEEKNVAEIIVAKNRHGETGTVKVQWLPQFTTFADREWKHSEG